MDLAARRESCDWEMTSRIRKEGIRMLVPDVQGFREYSILLAMRSRLELADRDYAKAAYTLQTGFALGRHVGEAPNAISALVGKATCHNMLSRVEEWIQIPDAPNLYWALTNLPRPLIDLRKPLEGEKLMLEAEFPDLRTLETEPLSLQEQQRLMKKLNDLGYWAVAGRPEPSSWQRKFGFLAAAMQAYPRAKRALIAQGRKAAEVEAMPVLQVILIDHLGEYRRRLDDMVRWVNLPYWQAREGLKKADDALHQASVERPATMLFGVFLPAWNKVVQESVRLDRHVAALRCIEAVRLHAVAHGGKPPAKLSDITEVPVPDDPATGKSFVYEVKGDRVTLREPLRADGTAALATPLHYELTFKR
jgi:hypothetical protein